ncbi:MAG: hypothetical protein CVV02_04385 [Firmicutes bacterium HGW-Firmicutes-7]|nr:MAG: hypothetical protein CVV02_04385 [Firmicutes bacterium HGW-Firmicutes-7]
MGSYIGMGLVYNGIPENGLESELKNVVNFLISHNGSINNIKFSKDRHGNEWTETIIDNKENENFYSYLSNGYFGQLHLICNILSIQKLNVYIRIEKNKNFFGLLLDISEEELIGTASIEDIGKITDNIIEFLNELYGFTVFAYAFCDNEAEIQYSPIEFQSQSLNEDIYSIVAIPDLENKNKLKIIKSNWHIDGLTTRII